MIAGERSSRNCITVSECNLDGQYPSFELLRNASFLFSPSIQKFLVIHSTKTAGTTAVELVGNWNRVLSRSIVHADRPKTSEASFR